MVLSKKRGLWLPTNYVESLKDKNPSSFETESLGKFFPSLPAKPEPGPRKEIGWVVHEVIGLVSVVKKKPLKSIRFVKEMAALVKEDELNGKERDI